MHQIHVVYYALLRQQRGLSEETIETPSSTPKELFCELNDKHKFKLRESQIKVAVNSKLAGWETPLNPGDTVLFIPPVAGG